MAPLPLDRGVRDPRRIAAALLILVGAGFMLGPALHAAFHCDEANLWKHVTRFGDGDWSDPGRPGLLWLLLTPALWLRDPARIALGLRLLSLLASIGTLWGVWRLATRPAEGARGIHPEDRGWGGILALLLLLTSMSWQAHSFEVRTDTFVLPLTLLAMHRLWREDGRPMDALLAGLAVGVAALFSQKTLYNGVAIGLGWLVFLAASPGPLRWRTRARTAAIAAGVAGATIALWYGILGAVNDGGAVSRNLGQAANNAFLNPRPFKTNFGALRIAARWGEPLYFSAALAAPVALFRARRQPRGLAAGVAFAVMLGTMAVHRGYFLYFIASFEPYGAILGGAGLGALLSWLHRRLPRAGPVWAGLVVLIGVGAGLWDNLPAWRLINRIDNEQQLQIQREVRELFPQPVPYWDSIGLIPGYRETTFFGTGAVRAGNRRARGASMYVDLARAREPLFFLRDYMTRDRYLRPDERRWQWRHYLPYRPNLYLRGGRLAVEARRRVELAVEIVRDGPYSVVFWGRWKGKAQVDGRPVEDGDVIELRRGTVTLSAEAERGWGQLWILLGEGRRPAATRPSEVIDWSLYPRLGRERYQSYDSRSNSLSDLLVQKKDPRGARNWSARRRRHRRWQRRRAEELAQP